MRCAAKKHCAHGRGPLGVACIRCIMRPLGLKATEKALKKFKDIAIKNKIALLTAVQNAPCPQECGNQPRRRNERRDNKGTA